MPRPRARVEGPPASCHRQFLSLLRIVSYEYSINAWPSMGARLQISNWLAFARDKEPLVFPDGWMIVESYRSPSGCDLL